MSLDHYYPLAEGGVDEVFNVVCSCHRCNNNKGAEMYYDYEDVIVQLFKQAVQDGVIKGKDLKLSNRALKKEINAVDRLERLGEICVFQSKTMRYQYKDGYIINRIYLK